MRIAGKVALITGASEGIGRATAEALARRGARLSLVARSADKLAEVGGPDTVRTAGDLTDPEVRRRAVEATIKRFGAIDILINNAGVGLYAPAWRAPDAEVRQMTELNLFAALGMIQLAVPGMRERGGGMIVNVSSIAGLVALPWFTLYSASKFALVALTAGLRMELKRDRIHCMAVCPGYVRTGFQRNALAGSPPEGLYKQRRFIITAAQCAEAIARGIERESRTVVTPRFGWLLLAASRWFPSLVEGQLERIYRTLKMV